MARNWVAKLADRTEQRARRLRPAGGRIVCESGVSPSGPIHLGNLREPMTVHLVAEDLRRRGLEVDHVHSWDDYDRFRKVPAGVPDSFAEHIGRPLAAVPDPGGEYPSYAERHIQEFEAALARLGVVMRSRRQSQLYPAGTYREQIKVAMAQRLAIFDILAEYQTEGRHELPREERRRSYYPFTVYCEECGRDDTTILDYDPATASITYRCVHCGGQRTISLDERVPGKLAWKVDWPMRWHFERVDFEPAGMDHATPGSSFTVGDRIIRQVFGSEPPLHAAYEWVGTAGTTKLSSSAGTSATPGTALEVLEPPILRWLYARRDIAQPFTVDFGTEVLRLYDEWDRLSAAVASGTAGEGQRWAHDVSVATSAGPVARSQLNVPFRVLSSAVDVTQGHRPQVLRIAAQHVDGDTAADLEARIEPRLSCAERWVQSYVPDEDRIQVATDFDAAAWAALGEADRSLVATLLDRMEDDWTLAGLTRLVYGIPKLAFGLGIDDAPSTGVKRAQRAFFVALYRLLVGADTGPRIPTLLLSLGPERTRRLLTAR